MNVFENLTLGYVETIRVKNGCTINHVSNINDIDTYIENNKLSNPRSEKGLFPALYVYNGIKGEFNQSNIFFIDIDTTIGVDFVLENSNILFLLCPNLLFIQKSPSGKLHIAGTMGIDTTYDILSYKNECIFNSIYVLAHINNMSIKQRNQELNYLEIKGAFDTHNTTPTQGLYLSHNPVIYNDNHVFIGIDSVKDDILKLCDKYNIHIESTKKYSTTNLTRGRNGNITPTDSVDNYSNFDGEKYTINRNFKEIIRNGKYVTGNDARWQIRSYLISKFGIEGANDICTKLFTNATEIIKATNNVFAVFHEVSEWVDKVLENYKTKSNEKFAKEHENTIDIVEYMSEADERIIELLNDCKYVQLVGQTGIGKTYCINNKLAQRLNAVVIVPFNVNNNLYNNLNIVSSEGGVYTEDKPCVMIWDQAIKYDLSKRNIIIDESHMLFKNREYRDSAVILMNNLKDIGCNSILSISATPLGEIEELGLETYYIKPKNRPHIKISVIDFEKESSILRAVLQDIKNEECMYDHVIVFNDKINTLLYDRLLIDGYGNNVIQLRSDTKDTEGFKSVIENELITKPITLATCIAYNGLNFKNEGKILIIMVFTEGETLYSDIVQAVGRFRHKNAQVDVHLYVQDANNTHTVEERADKAIILSNANIMPDEISYDRRLTDDKIRESNQRIEKYVDEHAHWNIVEEQLLNTGYIDIQNLTCLDCKKTSEVNQLKRDASRVWKRSKLNGIPLPDKAGMKKYFDKWESKWNKMLEQYVFVDDKFLYNTLSKSKSETMMDTVLADINLILKVGCMSESEYNNTLQLFNVLARDCKDKYFYSDIKSTIKKYESIRKQYGYILDNTDKFFEIYCCDVDEIFKEYKEKKALTGSKGGAHKHKVEVLYDNELHKFDSKSEADSWLKDHGLSCRMIAKFKLNKKNYRVQN